MAEQKPQKKQAPALTQAGERRDGNIVYRGNIPVAQIIAGQRIPLKGRAAGGEARVTKQEIHTIGDDIYVFQHVQSGEQPPVLQINKAFFMFDKNGLPLADPAGYVKKNKDGTAGRKYRTTKIDGTVVGLRQAWEIPAAEAPGVISVMQRLRSKEA